MDPIQTSIAPLLGAESSRMQRFRSLHPDGMAMMTGSERSWSFPPQCNKTDPTGASDNLPEGQPSEGSNQKEITK